MLDVTEAVRSSGLESRADRDARDDLRAPRGAVLDAARRLPGGTERLCKNAPEIVAQLHWAVESELAVSLQDVLLRRTGLGTGPCLGLDCAPAIAQRMGALLGWSPRRAEAELDAYDALRPPGPPLPERVTASGVARPSRKPGMMGRSDRPKNAPERHQ